MEYQIKGGNLPVVVCNLEPGETMFTESGGMAWMSSNIKMNTNMEGGLFGGLARKLSGESFFMTSYTCIENKGFISFASSFPGEIKALELEAGQSIICQKRAFLAAERSIKLEMHFRKQLGAGFFGGEGFILQRITGPGVAFFELDGAVVEYLLEPGEQIKVDTGHIAMFEPSVKFDVSMVKGFKNIMFGGEGLFLSTLTGPGRVWLQTMPFINLVGQIIPYVPNNG